MTRHVIALISLISVPLALQDQPTFRSNVNLVRVDVLVTEGGRPLLKLLPSDFELLDNGVRHRIASVDFEDVALDVLLMLDTSASVSGAAVEHLKIAAREFITRLGQEDRAGLLTFSSHPVLRAPLSSNLGHVMRALSQVTASGSTSLLDALEVAVTLNADPDRRACIVVFTDGQDNASWLNKDQVLEIARRSGATIYAITMDPAAAWLTMLTNGKTVDLPDDRFLRRLVDDTGGRLFYADSTRNIGAVFQNVLREMKSRYVLAYYPERSLNAGWHDIEVRVHRPGVIVRARRGYFAERSAAR